MSLNEDAKNKIVLEALVAEAGRLGDAIAERQAAAERFVSVAGVLAGAGLTLGLIQNQKTILVGLPLALVVIFLFMIQIYTDASMHSGHRQALEERLSTEFGRPFLVGQSSVAAGYARRKSVPWTFALVMLVWVGTFILGIRAILDLYDGAIARSIGVGFYLLLTALALWVLFSAMQENINAEVHAKKLALDAWNSGDGGKLSAPSPR